MVPAIALQVRHGLLLLFPASTRNRRPFSQFLLLYPLRGLRISTACLSRLRTNRKSKQPPKPGTITLAYTHNNPLLYTRLLLRSNRRLSASSLRSLLATCTPLLSTPLDPSPSSNNTRLRTSLTKLLSKLLLMPLYRMLP